MDLQDDIINRVADSGLITIDLEAFYPSEEKVPFDLKDFLFRGLILKEKDYREALKTLDWEFYRNRNVAIHCSADAIVPVWAYMLAGIFLMPVAKRFYFCTPEELDARIFMDELQRMDTSEYSGKRIIIKGCSNQPVPPEAFVEITRKLGPVVKSLMFGEACSNVPLFKQKTLPVETVKKK